MKYQLPKVNPWVAAISVFLTVLLAYYSFLGYRYWAATSEVETSTQRIADLQLEMKRSTASRLNSERAQDESERQVQSAQRAFRTFTSESMLLLVSESADESGVVLMSVVVGGGGLFTKDKTTYRSFPVSLNLQ
ncbi:MAG: hypothetical protein FJ317_02695, partial [SAR202 cluster bacterium]|nr:hypothetical protein [SAR202 cluster bacterium]